MEEPDEESGFRMLSGRNLGPAIAAVHEKLDILDQMSGGRVGSTPRTARERVRRAVGETQRPRGHSGNGWNRRSP